MTHSLESAQVYMYTYFFSRPTGVGRFALVGG